MGNVGRHAGVGYSAMLKCIAAVIILTPGSGVVMAQAPAPESSGIVISTTSRLVQLNIVARDKKGAPVTDLTKDDLILKEDGKQQNLAVFSLEQGEKIGAVATQLPAGFFTNRLEHKGGVPNSATVLLFDTLNTQPGYFGRARPKIAKFLAGIDPQLRVAIYMLSRSGLRVVHDFTTDTALLTRKLDDVNDTQKLTMSPEAAAFLASIGDPSKAAQAITGGGSGLDVAAALIAWADQAERATVERVDTSTTINALAAVAARLAAVPGRKNLVWVSTGFRLAPTGADQQIALTSQFGRAIRALNDASVAVYSVDARGLLALTDELRSPMMDPRSIPSPRQRRMTFDPGPTDQKNTMEQVARQTGGRMYFGSEIDEALPQVFEHSRVSYTAGYYPTNPNYDGKYRRISVQTQRKDVILSYRAGYYAQPDLRSMEEQKKAELLGAVWSPIDATAIGVDAQLERTSGNAPEDRQVVIQVDGRDLVFEPEGAGYRCRLELYIVQKDAQGNQVDGTWDNVDVPLTADKVRTLQKAGFAHRRAVRLNPKTGILRIIVRNGAGALGSLSIPLPKQ